MLLEMDDISGNSTTADSSFANQVQSTVNMPSQNSNQPGSPSNTSVVSLSVSTAASTTTSKKRKIMELFELVLHSCRNRLKQVQSIDKPSQNTNQQVSLSNIGVASLSAITTASTATPMKRKVAQPKKRKATQPRKRKLDSTTVESSISPGGQTQAVMTLKMDDTCGNSMAAGSSFSALDMLASVASEIFARERNASSRHSTVSDSSFANQVQSIEKPSQNTNQQESLNNIDVASLSVSTMTRTAIPKKRKQVQSSANMPSQNANQHESQSNVSGVSLPVSTAALTATRKKRKLDSTTLESSISLGGQTQTIMSLKMDDTSGDSTVMDSLFADQVQSAANRPAQNANKQGSLSNDLGNSSPLVMSALIADPNGRQKVQSAANLPSRNANQRGCPSNAIIPPSPVHMMARTVNTDMWVNVPSAACLLSQNANQQGSRSNLRMRALTANPNIRQQVPSATNLYSQNANQQGISFNFRIMALTALLNMRQVSTSTEIAVVSLDRPSPTITPLGRYNTSKYSQAAYSLFINQVQSAAKLAFRNTSQQRSQSNVSIASSIPKGPLTANPNTRQVGTQTLISSVPQVGQSAMTIPWVDTSARSTAADSSLTNQVQSTTNLPSQCANQQGSLSRVSVISTSAGTIALTANSNMKQQVQSAANLAPQNVNQEEFPSRACIASTSAGMMTLTANPNRMSEQVQSAANLPLQNANQQGPSSSASIASAGVMAQTANPNRMHEQVQSAANLPLQNANQQGPPNSASIASISAGMMAQIANPNLMHE